MQRKITIAIDGFSSTGKSTVAKKLAAELGYVYVDTGAMYRAVTLYALNNDIIGDSGCNKRAMKKHLPEIKLHFEFNEKLGYAEIYLNGKNVEKEIRMLRVSSFVSPIAAIKEVRVKLVEIQQEMGKNKGIVMDGRDIGTVVFPDAELKLFLTASAETRAHRRYKELLDRGDEVSYEQVLKNVTDRDYIDSHRENSPLVKAEDAIEIDNSDMGLEEQFERIYGYALRLIKNSPQ
ncbi:(d)CMP kinase [Leptobacterium flavescens]|uniref:Cytidylate kinase n=1 Tax=Leptobacterium flavescens TaxID=472055 RepID=A0A6P0UQF8_9FLAO|nr:(d)CMP kinase [Leptobacterium flavescens]NER14059.1 (d)CMP kinase [Leptobacterium flavescens]